MFILRQDTLVVNHSVLPDRGEDGFAVFSTAGRSLLCVADGCGGLGSKRYPALGDRTGAFIASRLVCRIVREWAAELRALPQGAKEGREALRELEAQLDALFGCFVKKNGMTEGAGRIVGSMQRTLPSTLCAAVTENTPHGLECRFVWAGDSRGFALDASGLSQYTRDDVRTPLSPFERLYCDAPLSNYICADQAARLHMRGARLPHPSVLICATDGAFACLPTPMEFEMLLLSTMQAAGDEAAWQRKLASALAKLANDDATVLCRPCGYESFARMKQLLSPRLEELRKTYITPVRRRKGDRDFARARWESYRARYDQTGGESDDDWRV